MAKQWRRWGESEGRGILEEFARSGVSEVSFCLQRGIGRQRLRYWRKRLSTKMAEPAFVPVDLGAAVGGSTATEIAIRVGDVAVCVREDLDVEHVARLVAALRGHTRAC